MNGLGVWGYVPVIILFGVIAAVIQIVSKKSGRMSRDEVEYYELNRKQFYRGVEAKTLSTAKDALQQLESGYLPLKGRISKNSEKCYDEDIADVKANVEDLVYEKWIGKAEKILDEFLSLYRMITDPSYANIEVAYHSKAKCLKKYDAYWDWVHAVHEENKAYLNRINLWNEAKDMFRENFVQSPEEAEMLVWSESPYQSTRQRIEQKLTSCIYAMQPEYRQKLALRQLVLQKVQIEGTIPRSVLLSKDYPDFTDKEIASCYRGLVKDMLVVEVKQGNRFFVSLTEKGKQQAERKGKK